MMALPNNQDQTIFMANVAYVLYSEVRIAIAPVAAALFDQPLLLAIDSVSGNLGTAFQMYLCTLWETSQIGQELI